MLRVQTAVLGTLEHQASLVSLEPLELQANLVPKVPLDLLERRVQQDNLAFKEKQEVLVFKDHLDNVAYLGRWVLVAIQVQLGQ